MTAGPSIWRQGAGYGLVGILQLLLDWACFVALSSLGLSTIAANMAGRVGGAVLGFWLNGALTFREAGASRLGWPRFRRFFVSWAIMSLLSTVAMQLIDTRAGLQWAWILKPAVDIVLAGLGFLASRYWIYR